MKYDLEITLEPKPPVLPLYVKLDEKVVREFKHLSKVHGVSMTLVLTKMLKEFISEYHGKGLPRQSRMF